MLLILSFNVLRSICDLPFLPGFSVGELHSILWMSTFSAQNHESRVNCYTCEPSREPGVPVECFQMNIGLHPRILDHVLGIVLVLGDPIDESESRARVPSPQFLKSWPVPSLGCSNEHFVGCSSGQEING